MFNKNKHWESSDDCGPLAWGYSFTQTHSIFPNACCYFTPKPRVSGWNPGATYSSAVCRYQVRTTQVSWGMILPSRGHWVLRPGFVQSTASMALNRHYFEMPPTVTVDELSCLSETPYSVLINWTPIGPCQL